MSSAAAAAAAAAAVCRLVFEALPRRIQLHLPDSRLLLQGQAAAAADEAAAGPPKQRQHWWRRKQAMRTGVVQAPQTDLCSK
jgi:hypothetical protein